MSCSTSFAFLFSLLTLGFLVQPSFGDGYLFHICSSSGCSKHNTYEENLSKLVGSLSIQAPPSGFATASIGQNPNQVYGLALCRGDVSSQDCKTCIEDASSELIKERCPSGKRAIIWYDYCLFKYSYKEFFGQIAYQNRFYMWNLNNVSDPGTFNQNTKELLSQLAGEAYASPKLYATGEMQLSDSRKLYGLTQCTRDISSSDCKKCLDDIIRELPSCCNGKEGGRVVGGSCNFRYEIYPFVNV